MSLVQAEGRAARLLKNIIWEAPRSVSPLTLYARRPTCLVST